MLVNAFGGEIREGETCGTNVHKTITRSAGERYEITVTAGACIPVNDIFVRRTGSGFEEIVTE